MLKIRQLLQTLQEIEFAYRRGQTFKVNFATTWQCNSRCQHCNIWRIYIDRPEQVKQEVKLGEVEAIFKNWSRLTWVSLTGGEPFLRSDLVDIARIINECCKIKILSIPTNGLTPELIERKVTEIAKLKIPFTFISVSLDGTKEIHSRVRGVDLGYDRAIDTLTRLDAIGRDFENLSCGFEYTISPFNAGSLKLLIDDLNQRGLVSLVNKATVTITHIADFYRNESLASELDDTFKLKAIEDITEASKHMGRTSLNGLLGRVYLNTASKYLRTWQTPVSCTAARGSLFIDPYANVAPCTMMSKPLFNLRDTGYQLKPELLKQARQALKTYGCPQCWTPCEAYQSLITNTSFFFKHLLIG